MGPLALSIAAPANDRIELADGSVLVGKLKVETSFAGTIEIVQAQMKYFSTDDASISAWPVAAPSSAFFDPANGGYVRASIEKDTIKQHDLPSSASPGNSSRTITRISSSGWPPTIFTRINRTTRSSIPPVPDMAFLHTSNFVNSKLTNTVADTPSFKNFSNYRLHHESTYEIPLGSTQRNMTLGMANDYQSTPPAGTKRLGTTYFTACCSACKYSGVVECFSQRGPRRPRFIAYRSAWRGSPSLRLPPLHRRSERK